MDLSATKGPLSYLNIVIWYSLLVLSPLPTVQSQNCTTELKECISSYHTLNTTYNNLMTSHNACSCGEEVVDPCASVEVLVYDKGLHIAAIFIVLIASMLGAGIPIVSKYSKTFHVNPYVICLGKCMGIGIVLACSLVHMIQPSNESLTSPCVPYEFNTDYTAYAYLFAMLAALCMQFLDFCMLQYITKHFGKSEDYGTKDDVEMEKKQNQHSHTHTHNIILEPGMEKKISAYMLEFGVAVHSIFIGLENGVVDEQTLKGLLVALCFHQFFEGVALGSRIADAHLTNHFHEFILAFIFSIASPIGIAVGVIVNSTLNTNAETFLLIQGTFDGVCGGILLYIGFVLLLKDFPESFEIHCRDKKNSTVMCAGLFAALWVGAGLMAYIGKYL